MLPQLGTQRSTAGQAEAPFRTSFSSRKHVVPTSRCCLSDSDSSSTGTHAKQRVCSFKLYTADSDAPLNMVPNARQRSAACL